MIIKNWSPSSREGWSPFQSAIKQVRLGNDLSEASIRLMQNGGAIGILAGDPGSAEQNGFSEGEPTALKRSWEETYRKGLADYGKIAISGKPVKWHPMGMNAVDLNIAKFDYAILRKLCAVMRLSSQGFNDPENTTYNNVNEAKKQNFNDGCLTRAIRFRDTFNSVITDKHNAAGGDQLYLDFDLSAVAEIQEDLKSLREFVTSPHCTMYSPNEKRILTGGDAVDEPGMDEKWMPMNMVPMSSIINQPQ
jgi:phage portal protein BeeE